MEEYVLTDFDLELTDFTHVPIKNELLIQNLEDMQDRQRIRGNAIDLEGYNPTKVILKQLRDKPEIDYMKCSALLFKLITQLCGRYDAEFGTNGMQNIVMMYKRDIGNKLYQQQYCEAASRWGKANGYKEWRYLFIPSKQVPPNSFFMQLAHRFQEL